MCNVFFLSHVSHSTCIVSLVLSSGGSSTDHWIVLILPWWRMVDKLLSQSCITQHGRRGCRNSDFCPFQLRRWRGRENRQRRGVWLSTDTWLGWTRHYQIEFLSLGHLVPCCVAWRNRLSLEFSLCILLGVLDWRSLQIHVWDMYSSIEARPLSFLLFLEPFGF